MKSKIFPLVFFMLLLFLLAGKKINGRVIFINNGCPKCHGYNGKGGTMGPNITGKSYEYYFYVLKKIKENNLADANPTMSMILKDFSEKELNVTAKFLASL